MKTEHLLIMRFSALGDVAMLVPVVSSLAEQYSYLRVTVLSRPFARPLFDSLSPNISFMDADIDHEYNGVHGLNVLYRRLSAKHFTAVADMHGILRTAYLRKRFWLEGYQVAHIDKRRGMRRNLTKNGAGGAKALPSTFDNYAEVLAKLGYNVSVRFRSLFPPAGGNLQLLPQSIGDKKTFRQWIGIAPFAAHKGKMYPPSMMESVIEEILRLHPSCRIFLFGAGRNETKKMNQWAERYPRCVNASRLCGCIQQELILMSHLDVMVSMDSANMHLASLTATPVVSVWGATHPAAGFLGWGQSLDNAVQAKLSCRPCSIFGNKPCARGDYACLNLISPTDIVHRVEQVINSV